jgi:hypothetical protein
MNKKTKFLTRLLTLALSVILLVSAAEPAYAQRNKKKDQEIKSVIPKDKRSWAGFPWLVGGALAAAAIALGIKSAKRTHLD